MENTIPTGDSAITRSNKRGYEKENTFAGVLSFMRRQYTKNLADAQVVVSGVPLDLATTNRTGARLGPAAIRAASVQMNEPVHPWGYGPCDRLSVIDYGDCWLDTHNPHVIHPEDSWKKFATGKRFIVEVGSGFMSMIEKILL